MGLRTGRMLPAREVPQADCESGGFAAIAIAAWLSSMRILYGVHTQGQGGLAKASVLVPLMESRGHEVRVVTSGALPPTCYNFTWHRHYPGLEYVVAAGRADYGQTISRWLKESPRVLKGLWKLRGLVREFQPQLVLSDFEPLTCSPLVDPRCEVLAVSRPCTLLDPAISLPEGRDFERKMARTAVRLFTCGADRRCGYHLEPASYRCLPPVMTDDVSRYRSTEGEHILVYNVYHTFAGSADTLIEWAARRRQEVIAYGFPQSGHRGRVGKVDFRPAQRHQFLSDLASAKAVITTAGMCLPLEAFLLRKPLCVVPIPGQWEQVVNAYHLQEAGMAHWSDSWDYDQLLELPAPSAQHPLQKWLTTPPDSVVARLLGEPEPTRKKQTHDRIAA